MKNEKTKCEIIGQVDSAGGALMIADPLHVWSSGCEDGERSVAHKAYKTSDEVFAIADAGKHQLVGRDGKFELGVVAEVTTYDGGGLHDVVLETDEDGTRRLVVEL
jgi:hypothetical protein